MGEIVAFPIGTRHVAVEKLLNRDFTFFELPPTVG